MTVTTNERPGMRGWFGWLVRRPWPREAKSFASAVPALVAAVPMGGVRPYQGRSRFVISPLSLTLDQFLLVVAAALLCMGLLMVGSADARVRGVHEGLMLKDFLNKNLVHASVAVGVLVLIWRLDYRWLIGRSLWISPALWLIVVTIGSLAAVLVFGKRVNGAARWLGYGSLQFQPSELAKLGLVTFIAAYAVHCERDIRKFGVSALPILLCLLALAALVIKPSMAAKLHMFQGEHGETKFRMLQGGVAAGSLLIAGVMWRFFDVRRWTWGFVPLMTVFGATLALVLVEDFGTTALVAVVSFVLLLMAGCRWWHVGMLIPPGAFAVWAMIFKDHDAWRYKRFVAFLDPWADPQGAGYHPIQSLLTITSGGFWGRGLGNGIQKMGYLPEDNTDFIFAVICEELGFVGAAMVIGLFVCFVLLGWRIASRCQNPFGKMLAFGVTAVIGLQAAINIAVVTVSMPTKGIALPLISSGGTGWIMNAAAIGLLMSIERVNRRESLVADRARRGAEPALGFPVQVAAIPARPVAAVPAVSAAAVVPAVPTT